MLRFQRELRKSRSVSDGNRHWLLFRGMHAPIGRLLERRKSELCKQAKMQSPNLWVLVQCMHYIRDGDLVHIERVQVTDKLNGHLGWIVLYECGVRQGFISQAGLEFHYLTTDEVESVRQEAYYELVRLNNAQPAPARQTQSLLPEPQEVTAYSQDADVDSGSW